jgi:ABC-type amino acid transport substrate-binding protein
VKLAIVKKLLSKHHDSESDDHHDSESDDHHDSDSDDDSDHHEFPLVKKLVKLAILKKVLGGGHHERGGLLKTLIKAKILKAVASKLHGDDDDDHTWTFAMGDDFGAYNYLDAEGHLKGFNVDLMHAVCEVAHKKCYFIEDRFSHCWHNDHIHESPGEGLLDGWYDGCFGFESTPERVNSFDFTDDYSEKEHSSLYYRTGEPALTDLAGKKIGFVHGWASSVHCLERQGNAFQHNKHTDFIPMFFQDHDELEDALQNKTVDVVFSEDVFDHEAEVKKGVTQDTHELYCSDHGEAIMTRHDSPVIKWWNKAFKSFKKSGKFKALCEKAKKEHAAHGVIHCDLH